MISNCENVNEKQCVQYWAINMRLRFCALSLRKKRSVDVKSASVWHICDFLVTFLLAYEKINELWVYFWTVYTRIEELMRAKILSWRKTSQKGTWPGFAPETQVFGDRPWWNTLDWVETCVRIQTSVKPSFEMRALALGNVVWRLQMRKMRVGNFTSGITRMQSKYQEINVQI